MMFQGILSGVAPHDFALDFLLCGLERRGHTVHRRARQDATSNGCDASISNTLAPFLREHQHFVNPARPWILHGHGMALHKHWTVGTYIDFSLYPTALWVHYGERYVYHGDCCLVAAGGWAKLDFYHKLLGCRREVRSEIYSQMGLIPQKPLVVYAPTWSRPTAESWALWQQDDRVPDGAYVNSGTEYMRHRIIEQIERLDVNLIYMPHTGGTDAATAAGFWPSRRVEVLVAADLIVGDISSVLTEALCLDVPIVHVRREPEDRRPGDYHVFANTRMPMCEFGDVVDVADLPDVVRYRLSRADDYAGLRRFWRESGCGVVDGHAADREAVLIEEAVRTYS